MLQNICVIGSGKWYDLFSFYFLLFVYKNFRMSHLVGFCNRPSVIIQTYDFFTSFFHPYFPKLNNSETLPI